MFPELIQRWPPGSLKDEFLSWQGGSNKKIEPGILNGFIEWLKTVIPITYDEKEDKEVRIGKWPAYSAARDEVPEYCGRIAKTRELTMYSADAVVYRADIREAWPIEVEMELTYEAIGQALSYEYAFSKVRDGILEASYWDERTRHVSKKLSGMTVKPAIVCFVAPFDQCRVCEKLSMQVFYCQEGHLTKKGHWAN